MKATQTAWLSGLTYKSSSNICGCVSATEIQLYSRLPLTTSDTSQFALRGNRDCQYTQGPYFSSEIYRKYNLFCDFLQLCDVHLLYLKVTHCKKSDFPNLSDY